MNFNFKTPIAILGFGVEGQHALHFLQKQGITDVTVCDEYLKSLGEDRDLRLRDSFKNLSDFATLIRSPGVPYNHPSIAEAKKSGTVVTSMTELTLETARDRLTAVTGSNGKSTTVGLTAAILRAHYGPDLIVGGNDRAPILQQALDHPKWPILMEVSSFQFADLRLSPHIAAILNITPNHLDWHKDMEDYLHAKNNLIQHQTSDDWAVLNASDESSEKLSVGAPGNLFWVGKEDGLHWAAWKNGILTIRQGGKPVEIITQSDIALKTHPDNLLFAAALSALHNVPPAAIAKEMKAFKSIPHRLEFVREWNRIKFYNDSSCTTPESAELAISQFPEGQLILLLGGSSKKADFSFLASKIVRHKVRIILYGQEGPRIGQAVKEAGGEGLILRESYEKNLSGIIEDAISLAHPNDFIVFSPACASFDMFKNAKDRGDQFREVIVSLP